MGRDLLIGAVYGVVIFVVEASDNFLLPLFGKLPPIPGGVSTESLLGLRHAVAQVLLYVLGQTIDSLGIFFILFILQRILRSAWIAAIVVAAAGTLLSLGNNGGEYPWISAVFLVVLYLSFLLVLKRFGLLVLVVGLVVQQVLLDFPGDDSLVAVVCSAFASGNDGNCGVGDLWLPDSAGGPAGVFDEGVRAVELARNAFVNVCGAPVLSL